MRFKSSASHSLVRQITSRSWLYPICQLGEELRRGHGPTLGSLPVPNSLHPIPPKKHASIPKLFRASMTSLPTLTSWRKVGGGPRRLRNRGILCATIVWILELQGSPGFIRESTFAIKTMSHGKEDLQLTEKGAIAVTPTKVGDNELLLLESSSCCARHWAC